MKNLFSMKNLGVICASVLCFSCVDNANVKLAKEIREDRSIQVVDSMGRAILAQGFNAGSGYSQVWARDMNTFVETACEVVDPEEVKGAIKVFFALQQPNGEMIDGYVLKGEFNWDDSVRYYTDAAPDHVGFKNTVETDQETSLIQIVGKYIDKTGDRGILKEVVAGKTIYDRMKDMVAYLLREKYNKEYGLLTGALTADWGDVQANDSVSLVDINEYSVEAIDAYDNAMFVIAMDYMSKMAEDGAEKAEWKKLQADFRANTRKYLWDDERNKIIPHVYPEGTPDFIDFDENTIHYHGGTAIAIEAGILEKDEVAIVNQQMLENVRLSQMPSIGLTLYPTYPDNFFHGGMAKPYIYQNGGDWTWFGGRMIQQLIAYGYVQEAYEEVRPMIDRVIKNKGFYEWYGQKGVPSGSGHFKGSAGVLCKAFEMFNNWSEGVLVK